MITSVVTIAVLGLLWARAVTTAEFHVAATGNNTNPGPEAKPLATLERARDEIRRLEEAGLLKEPDAVSVGGGTWQHFVPDAPFVGAVNGSYIDPEFSESAGQVVFQAAQNRVWIGDIDPETGLFKTATGRDRLMDEDITIIFDRPPQGRKFSTNGPEWTRDAQGHGVVYTKADKAGIMQQWMARLVDGKSVVTQLTHNTFDCYGNMPSRFQDGKPPRVAYTYDWPIWKAKAAWIFADKPDEPQTLDDFDYRQMSMWSAVSPDFLFVKHPPGAPHGQIARANADTGQVTMLTDDKGEKNDPGLFLAPEFGGEMLLVCNVDNSALGIYRDEQRDGQSPWTRIATLKLPDDAPYKFISSPETIAPATGLTGVSCFALLARQSKDRNTPGSIWVLGLGMDEQNRFARRVDDGAVTGEQSVVLEPEPFVGRKEVYVYYNYYSRTSGKHGLRRAGTGIKITAAPPDPQPTPTPRAVQRKADSAPSSATSAASPAATLVAGASFNVDSYFQGLDENGDGKLSRAELDSLPGLKAGLDYFDANHDGGITLQEMRTAIAWWQQRQAGSDEPPAINAPPKRLTTTASKRPAPKRPTTVDTNSPQFRGPRGDGDGKLTRGEFPARKMFGSAALPVIEEGINRNPEATR